MKVELQLDLEQAQLVSQLLHAHAAKKSCPPGCIVADEIAQTIDMQIRFRSERAALDDRHRLRKSGSV